MSDRTELGARPRIVVGVNNTGTSLTALRWAAAEARRTGAMLQAVHVMLPRPGYAVGADGRRIVDLALEAAFAMQPPGVPVLRSVVRGQPGPALCAAARGSALLVVGAHELHPGRRMVLGSVSEYCVRHSPVPVVVVRVDMESFTTSGRPEPTPLARA